MPLLVLPLIGCDVGHAPCSSGSAHSGRTGRGTGGNGNGALASHCTLLALAGTRDFQKRHAAYASPTSAPNPKTRLMPIRIGEFSHAFAVRCRMRFDQPILT